MRLRSGSNWNERGSWNVRRVGAGELHVGGNGQVRYAVGVVGDGDRVRQVMNALPVFVSVERVIVYKRMILQRKGILGLKSTLK